ncbi:kinesin-like protein KIF19 [Diaphorina citri]|uniref:Kinesin-like protein n=1 Tax=Diaphorina citri TaxID=121845 RepID=A0A3Q0IKU6_DIACI|nr:kinesin-like protein KIF19 [Diaphorina citri]
MSGEARGSKSPSSSPKEDLAPPDTPRFDKGRRNSSIEKLIVAVRIRPLPAGETERCLHQLDRERIVVEEVEREKEKHLRSKRPTEKQFNYDIVLGEDATQDDVYQATTKNLVRDVLLGYNGTVFAYGATGSGKTHTMVGQSGGKNVGIMVRALNELFQYIETRKQRYTVTMSYLEIYNENIRDLLNPESGFLELREDSSKGSGYVQVSGLTETIANSTEEVMALLTRGNKQRSCESTASNRTSSRSHALLSVTVHNTRPIHEHNVMKTRIRQGRLFMIDLAGSERASHTKNIGKRLKEGAHINRSLLALGNCINALSGSNSNKYVNYRDSKLTRLLREALSGNCKTVMIAHVNPGLSHREESKNTLVYAARATGISHKVERNQLDVSFQISQYRSVIADLRNEISRLKHKISDDGDENDITNAEPSSKARDPELPNGDVEPNMKRVQNGELLASLEEEDEEKVNGEDGIGGGVVGNGGDPPLENQEKKAPGKVRKFREQIVSTFREQMRLRRKLMDIDGHLLSLGVEAERQHLIISQWESKHNKLYRGRPPSTHAQDDTTSEYLWNEHDRVNMHQAWSDLSYIEREQEKYVNLRSETVKKLDQVREKSVALEDELPSRLDSDTEKELLCLLIRVHELEADKMALQGERLVESHELRRRGEMLVRFHRQQKITDDIITRQRQIMEEERMNLPSDLQDLYSLYQQEIHATSYPVDTSGIPYTAYDALPPIHSKEILSNYGSTISNGSDVPLRISTSGGSSNSSDVESVSVLPPIQRTTLTAKQPGRRNYNIIEENETETVEDIRVPRDGTNHNFKQARDTPSPVPPPILFPPISNDLRKY